MAESASPASLRVLAVDDNAVNRHVLSALLARSPLVASVHLASDVPQAILALSRQAIDLVLLDIDLGQDQPLGGVDVCRALRQAASTPGPLSANSAADVVAVTSDVRPEQVCDSLPPFYPSPHLVGTASLTAVSRSVSIAA
jgi:CheY-like chemotaxis protein